MTIASYEQITGGVSLEGGQFSERRRETRTNLENQVLKCAFALSRYMFK